MSVRLLILAVALLVHAMPGAWAADLSCRVEAGRVSLGSGDRTYTLGDDGVLQPLGLRANVVGTDPAGKGLWMLPTKLREAKVIRDTEAAKAVTVVYDLSAGDPRYALELDLEARAGVPALFVRSRVRRLSEGSGSSYYFWGFSGAVTHYVLAGAGEEPFPNEWHVLPRSRWVFIGNRGTGKGYGVLTDGKVGRAPGSGGELAKGEVPGYPYLICPRRTTTLSQGGTHEVSFAVVEAQAAGEVEALFRQVGRLEPDRLAFDGQELSRKALMEGGAPAGRFTLATLDGLSLSLARDGRVAGVWVGKSQLAPASGALTGFLLRDFAAKSQPEAIGGEVSATKGGLKHSAKCREVSLSATYTAKPDRIDVHCELRDLTGRDRALTLTFAMPVHAAPGRRWEDDLERSRSIVPDEEYLSAAPESPVGANGVNSLYPFATLDGGQGPVAFGIPMDQPRFCRMAYNAETSLFFIAFDVALVPEVKRWPGRASIDFSLFTHEPEWGFRACAAKYYAMFPGSFKVRVKRHGGWVCWGDCKDVPNIEELCYAYHWGLSGPAAAKWDNDHGLYALPYIEATNMHQTMEEFPSATSADVVKRLQWIADPNRKEPIPAWHYDHPHNAALGDRDTSLRGSAQAYLNSLLYNERGEIYGSASKTEFGLLIAKYIPCNANPGLPEGVGAYFLDFWLPKVVKSFESGGGKVDGIAQDNYHVGDTSLSRRREQFPYESIPLSFETSTGKPVIVKNFTTYEWTAEYQRRHPGKLVIANTCSVQFPFTYHLLDVHGYEWQIEGLAPFARVAAYHKPVCSLPVQPAHKEEKWVKWHLRYGFMPGGYANYQTLLNREAMKRYAPLCRDLSQAGWEPVTLARSSDPDLTVERFGKDRFTLFNRGAAEKRARLTFDLARLGVTATKARDLLSGQEHPLSTGGVEIALPPGDVIALQLR